MGTFRLTAAVVAGGLTVGGLVAGCGPAPRALTCTAKVSSARPLQNTTEVVTVGTETGGVGVITTAALTTGRQTKLGVTNAHGAASMSFQVGTSAAGTAVKVTTTVAKGAQHGSCVTSFTPAVSVGTTSFHELPGVPIVERTAVNANTAGIAWTEADGNGLPITGWRVSRNGVDTIGTGAWSTVLSASATQFTFRSLKAGNLYALSLQAVTAAGVGPAATRSVQTSQTPSEGTGGCDEQGKRIPYGSICDGFQWVSGGFGIFSDAQAVRTPSGVLLTYTVTTPYHYFYNTAGTLSQIGSATQSVDSAYSGGPITSFIAGNFHSGNATLTLNGTGGYTSFPLPRTVTIGLHIS
jgi:hypothetical protein